MAHGINPFCYLCQMLDQIKQSKRFFLIAGPCAVEGEDMALEIAEKVQTICNRLGIVYIFKASYRKANRSRLDSFTGIGDQKALEIIGKVKKELGLWTTTDIHTEEEAAMAAEYTDVLQIPAFLCRQTSLLVAAAKTSKVVNIKKGQFMSPESMQFAVDKVKQSGNEKVWLTERGTMFGYQDLVVDFRGFLSMNQMVENTIMDCTHSLQQPNQSSGVTGGRPALIETMAKTAIAAGAKGLFIETHPNPEKALSDGANMLKLNKLEDILEKTLYVFNAVNP